MPLRSLPIAQVNNKNMKLYQELRAFAAANDAQASDYMTWMGRLCLLAISLKMNAVTALVAYC